MTTRCRVCGDIVVVLLWEGMGSRDTFWWGCDRCGSQTHDIDPAAVVADYSTADYVQDHCGVAPAPTPADMATHLDWFKPYQSDGLDFLDVGHLNGAALTAFHDAGWRVHGFDINPNAYLGPHTTIYTHFAAHLFPRQYDAVLCREVIEHVPRWRMMLMELWRVTKAGGVLNIQTPRPTDTPSDWIHHRHHLQLFAPAELDRWTQWAGFERLSRWEWETGQAVMLRRLA